MKLLLQNWMLLVAVVTMTTIAQELEPDVEWQRCQVCGSCHGLRLVAA
jgi:hypothetical protein